MALTLAAQTGDIDRLYALIATDPKTLADIDEIPFVDTPLHIAAKEECTYFAVEVMRLMPSFAKKLNPDGLSPLDVALRNNQIETAQRLVEIDSELIRIKGKKGWTPLHYVAQTDNVDLLADFSFANPPSFSDLTIEKETTLHVAASNGKIAAIEVLVGWATRTNYRDELRRMDDKGNTAVHVVASNPQHYANNLSHVLEILSEEIGCNEVNTDQLKAVDIISASTGFSAEQKEAAKRTLRRKLRIYYFTSSEFWFSRDSRVNFSKYLRSKLVLWEKAAMYNMSFSTGLTNERVNIILVVAALIITVSYQAALQPPSELRDLLNVNTDSSDFKMVMFNMLNNFTFYSSVAVIHYLLELTPASILLHLTLIYFGITFVMLGSHQRKLVYVEVITYGLLGFCITIVVWKLILNTLLPMLNSKNSRNLVAKRYVEMQHNVKLAIATI